MSLFEFVLVMASLILAIGVTLLLRHVAAVVRYRSSLELDWIALTWMAVLFLSTTSVWWSLWDFSDVEWTFPRFFYLLVCPTVQFVAISMLVSTDVSKSGASMSANFGHIRVPFMLLMAVFQVLVSWDGWIFGVEPFWNSLRSLQIVVIAAFVVGAISPRPSVQKFVVVFVVGLLIIGTFVLRYLPGAFVSQ